MIIDFHIHIGDFRSLTETKLQPVTWENLFQRMDDEGIDKAVLLPVFVSSENYIGPRFITEGGMDARTQVLEAQQYLDRIIPFGNLDCRWLGNSDKADYSPLLDWFQEHNCVGIGEVTSNVPIDDPRNINMFRQCGDRGLPVTIHNVGYLPGTYGLQDFPGMPGLAKLLETCPQTNVLGHGRGSGRRWGPASPWKTRCAIPRAPSPRKALCLSSCAAAPTSTVTYPRVAATTPSPATRSTASASSTSSRTGSSSPPTSASVGWTAACPI